MGETNRQFPVAEVAISMMGFQQSGGIKERIQVGDISGVRRPLGQIGWAEMRTYLWLHIEGLEENELFQLGDLMWVSEPGGERYDKRRYSIPLERLQQLFPTFDVNRALDTADYYQPFMPFDEDNGFTLIAEKPLSVHGLVFDKATMEFL